MKKFLSVILAIMILVSCGTAALAAADGTVTEFDAVVNGNTVEVSGTTSNINAAVAVQVLDADDNIIGMNSFVIDADGSFSGSVAFSGTAASARAADYDGGPWKTADINQYPLPPIILPPADDEDKPCDGGDKCSLKIYTDLDTGEWYHESVHFCVENGIMNGTSDTTFDPAGTTTRAQLITMLWRLEGTPYVNYMYGFKDVEPEQWYTEAIRWAAAEKIVNGYDAETFGTNDPVTREQTAAILYRYASCKGLDINSYTENVNTLSFDDVFEISEFAAPGMHFCIAAYVLQGYNNQLRPHDFATRVEMAAIFMRFNALFD